jgi:hypothetical protein
MIRTTVAAVLVALLSAAQSNAVVVDFTGGTVTRLAGPPTVTSNTLDYDNVDYYEEGGFRLDFLPNGGSGGFATHVGNYYGVGNDVIHSHWAAGSFGGVMTVDITKIGGGTFDLNYFILTSNTLTGGGFASGTELAYVQAYSDLAATTPIGPAVLLAPDDWGFGTTGPFPGDGVDGTTSIFLGSDFDAATLVRFSVLNSVDCFGMDEFFIDEPAPGGEVPEATSLVAWSLMGCTALGFVWYRRRHMGLAS